VAYYIQAVEVFYEMFYANFARHVNNSVLNLYV